MSTFEWGIQASDKVGMMGGSGCGHQHALIADVENCLGRAERRAGGEIRDAGIFHADGSELSEDDKEIVLLGLHRDAQGFGVR